MASAVLEPAIDPVLRRLPRGAWHALPMLTLAGLVSAVAYVAASFLLGAGSPGALIAAAALTAPALLRAADALQDEIFDIACRRSWRLRRVVRAELIVVVPAALAAWSMLCAEIAEQAQSAFLQTIAVMGTLLALLVAAVAVVAFPVAGAREDAGIRAIAVMALLSTLRRPLAPIAALAAGAAVVWIGLTWFAGVLVLAVPLLVALAVAAAWPTAAAYGVALPPLAPLPTRIRGER